MVFSAMGGKSYQNPYQAGELSTENSMYIQAEQTNQRQVGSQSLVFPNVSSGLSQMSTKMQNSSDTASLLWATEHVEEPVDTMPRHKFKTGWLIQCRSTNSKP